MGSIKRLKCDSDVFGRVLIDGVVHREYTVSEIPAKFGCKEFGENKTPGIDKWWSNHKAGVVYVDEEVYFPSW